MMPVLRPATLVTVTVAALALSAARGAAADRPASAGPASSRDHFSLVLESPNLVSDDAFMWVLRFKLVNSGDVGLYSDSLMCDVERLDPGLPERARRASLPLLGAARVAATVSGADSSIFEVQVPASAERARLTFRYYG
ncbi:MAG TPA: hypothetical protein VGA81_04120, partial [Methylomirabilota bacterium]